MILGIIIGLVIGIVLGIIVNSDLHKHMNGESK